jgi:predicted N-acetyltransferase YhbS
MRTEAPRGEELDYVVVRQYKPTDRTKLISLLREKWPDYDPGVYCAANYLIAENNGRIVGTVFCLEVNRGMHLYDLVVYRSLRRQGIAAALIKTAEKQAVEIGMENLHITASGPGLVAYYKNLGFVQTSPPSGRIMVKPIVCPQVRI